MVEVIDCSFENGLDYYNARETLCNCRGHVTMSLVGIRFIMPGSAEQIENAKKLFENIVKSDEIY